jgi:hypothetical protein
VNDLGFNIQQAVPWFQQVQSIPFVLVRVSEEAAQAIFDATGLALRRCYIADAQVTAQSQALGVPRAEIVKAVLPDPGPTMSGDFGEILVYFYQAVRNQPGIAFGAKKWRAKQDRTKPAPYSDVVQFVLPNWPTASDQDLLLCSEVKAKATDGVSTPIHSAIQDCVKDQVSRLADTLLWLREQVLVGRDIGSVDLPQIQRFLDATEHPPATVRFHAVAVISSALLDTELTSAPSHLPPGCNLIVIGVPSLREVYTRVFDQALDSANAQ